MIPKFRAWIENRDVFHYYLNKIDLLHYQQNEIMLNVKEIIYFEDDYEPFAAGFVVNDEIVHIPVNSIILMQCTGMKDITGKEIYEGDIVECGFSSDQKDLVTGIVEYNPEYSGFTIDDLSIGYMTAEYGFEYYKILGNKYENPELLKEE